MPVLDASFLVKIVVREEGSDRARRALREALNRLEDLHAPCIALAESLNALWKQHRLLGLLDERGYSRAVDRLLRLWGLVNSYAVEDLALDAARLARGLGITVYDAMYAALAVRLDEPLYTFDNALASRLRETGVKVYIP